jgi:hypothetical protein
MGMSSGIYGIKPADEKWKEMKAIWDACKKARINAPQEVYQFFEGNEPDERGVVVSLYKHEAIEAITPGYSEKGYIVDITKLPKDVKYIKFENSW